VYRRTVLALVFACFCGSQLTVHAQEFKLFARTVQVHGFMSQGFVYTNENNWLTMNTSQGSAAYTDFGLNMSTALSEKLRVGAQVYDRNLGQLGQYHPSLDWAVVDYRFTSWFGVRGGKVKTTLGLYTDTQDLDFLRVFALLPQSIYPTDLRDSSIAHLGGDIYGNIALRHRLGDLAYTAFAGHRSDSRYSGYTYLLAQYATYFSRIGGLQYGGDLRWNTPLKGMLIGASRMNEDLTAQATFISALDPGAGRIPLTVGFKAGWTNQFYGEYTAGKLRVDSEYRRQLHDQINQALDVETIIDLRGWYVSGTYRLIKRLAVGSYYSRYSITTVSGGGPYIAFYPPNQTNTSLPANHIYDKVVAARLDLNKFWNVKVEGHFMDGYGASLYPDGFYPQVNPKGFKPNTNALVLKTNFNF
jgi:hypothetical protein